MCPQFSAEIHCLPTSSGGACSLQPASCPGGEEPPTQRKTGRQEPTRHANKVRRAIEESRRDNTPAPTTQHTSSARRRGRWVNTQQDAARPLKEQTFLNSLVRPPLADCSFFDEAREGRMSAPQEGLRHAFPRGILGDPRPLTPHVQGDLRRHVAAEGCPARGHLHRLCLCDRSACVPTQPSQEQAQGARSCVNLARPWLRGGRASAT